MKYNPKEIEAKWQKYWLENETFKAENNSTKPKYYVLDMFPYPSGAGLRTLKAGPSQVGQPSAD